ncbi:MAG: GAF domain-containing protein, partial [Caldilineae bacterium]
MSVSGTIPAEKTGVTLPPDISILQAFAQISATVLDLDDLLTTALDILAHTFNFDLLAVVLVDDRHNDLQLKAYRSPHPVGLLETLYPAIVEAVDNGRVVRREDCPTNHPPPERLSGLVVPLTIGRLVIGALLVADSRLTHFSVHDEQLLSIFASQVTVAITIAQLYKKNREQQQQALTRQQIASHLQQLVTIINATLDLDDVLNLILEHIAVVIPYHSALLFLLEGRSLTVTAAAGAARDFTGYTIDLNLEPFYHQILAQQYPTILHDIARNRPRPLRSPPFLRDVHAWIGAPLVSKNKIIGLLSLHHTEPGYFDDADPELVHTFANQAAIGIDNAQLYQREQQKVRQFQTVAKIGRQVTEIREVQRLLDVVVERLHDDLGYEFVSIFLYQPKTESLHLRAASDIPAEKLQSMQIAISLEEKGVIASAGRNEETILVNDVTAFEGYITGPGRQDVRSEMAIPLMSQQNLLGVLDMQSTRLHAFLPDDLTLAQTVADQLAVAIGNAQMFEQRDQRLAELIAFSQIAMAIAAPSNLDRTLASVLERVKALYQVEGTSLMLLDGDALHFKMAVGLPPEMLEPFSIPLGEGIAGRVARDGKPIRIDDVT